MEKKSAACILGGDAEADVPIRSLTRMMEPIIGTSYLSSSTVVSDTETKKNKEKMYRPWSQLPDLMIDMVYDRLDFTEKIRFASVCTTWRSAAPEFARRRPQQIIPLLLFSPDTQSDEEFSLFNLPESMIYHVSIPQINMSLCYGSTEGWLFLFSDEQDELCFLLNPFTKARIQLPPFNLEPPQSVLKVILSSNPKINEDWMVVAHVASRGLIYCKSGDRTWFIGPPKDMFGFSYGDADIIFSGEVVYALGMLKSLLVFGLKTQEHVLMCGEVSAPPFDLHHFADSIDSEDGYITYLVESNGEVFLVARFLKSIKECFESENALQEGVDECQAVSYHYKTIKFLLYKLKENDNEKLRMYYDYIWVRQSSLGPDRALFLGTRGSKLVSSIDSPGIHSNSIYFINDLHPNTDEPCDIGIYHFEDDQIEPFIPFDSYSFKFPSVWVTPSI